MTAADLPALHAGARAAGAYCMARTATRQDTEIARALDMGADGIIVPYVNSRQAAEQVVAAGRFPPAGQRSLDPYVPGTGYGLTHANPTGTDNARTALIVMIEGADGGAAADQIADVADIDAIFIGPIDLAGYLGFPREPEHPEIVAHVGRHPPAHNPSEQPRYAGGHLRTHCRGSPPVARPGEALVVTSADAAIAGTAFTATHAALAGTRTPGPRGRQGHANPLTPNTLASPRPCKPVVAVSVRDCRDEHQDRHMSNEPEPRLRATRWKRGQAGLGLVLGRRRRKRSRSTRSAWASDSPPRNLPARAR